MDGLNPAADLKEKHQDINPGENPASDGEEASDSGSQISGIHEEVIKEMDPLQTIFHAFNYQEIIVRIYEKPIFDEKILFKSMNLQIKTRILEDISATTKCHNCNAIVYQGLLPKKRINEGIYFKHWKCTNKSLKKGGNRDCGHENPNPLSMSCKRCGLTRP